ncbi:DUF2974 domain-containing protein [Eubacteriaceae bacterium ES3]|nr:DUF2974 domain-containing protein [Eubacteriaceae bacterium ES3]
MQNIVDYIEWRGDLIFDEYPFNLVDNVILSVFSYVDFSGLVPGVGESGTITIGQLYEKQHPRAGGVAHPMKSLSTIPERFFKALASSRRFGELTVFNYKEVYDEEKRIQFAAVQIRLSEQTVYLAYRGTDQTLTGWREDFYMSFQAVESQYEAVRYLQETMMPGIDYHLGGHSKGGNLAVYAAMMCNDSLKEGIAKVYSNDGPGMSEELLHSEKYARIQGKITQIAPEFCVIGLLFSQSDDYIIVKSDQKGIMQHDALSWGVKGDRLIETKQFQEDCLRLNKTLETWLEGVGLEERKAFTDRFFDTLESGGAKGLDELATKGINGFEGILNDMIRADKGSKKLVGDFLKTAVTGFLLDQLMEQIKSRESIRGMFFIFIGLLLMQFPAEVLVIFGITLTLALFILTVFRFYHYLMSHLYPEKYHKPERIRNLLIDLLVLIIFAVAVINQKLLLNSLDLSLAVFFAIYAYLIFRGSRFEESKKIRAFQMIRALAMAVAGLIAFFSRRDLTVIFVMIAGGLLIAEGVVVIVRGLLKEHKNNAVKN